MLQRTAQPALSAGTRMQMALSWQQAIDKLYTETKYTTRARCQTQHSSIAYRIPWTGTLANLVRTALP